MTPSGAGSPTGTVQFVIDGTNFGTAVTLTGGSATVNDLSEFYRRLPNGDRQFVILPGMAHSVVLGLNRQLFWHAMRAFLTMPAGDKRPAA